MNEEVLDAGLDILAELIDNLDDEDRELTEEEQGYIKQIFEVVKEEASDVKESNKGLHGFFYKGIVRKKDKRGYNLCYDDVSGKRVSCGGGSDTSGDSGTTDKPAPKPSATKKPAVPKKPVEPKKPPAKVTPPKLEKKPKEKPAPKPKKEVKPKPTKQTLESVQGLLSKATSEGLNADNMKGILDAISSLTVKDMKEIRNTIKANTTGKVKTDIFDNIKNRLGDMSGTKPDGSKPEVATTKEEPKQETKPAGKPKLDYQQKNPDHPVAKSIREDAKTASMVQDYLSKVQSIRSSPESQKVNAYLKSMEDSKTYSKKIQEIMDRGGYGTSEYRIAQKQWRDSIDATNKTFGDEKQAKQAIAEVRAKEREALQEAFKTTKPPTLNIRYKEGDSITEQEKSSYKKGFDFISNLTEGKSLYPTGVFEDDITVTKSTTNRAYYSSSDGSVYMANYQNPDLNTVVTAHEVGHYLEDVSRGLKKKVHDFLNYRIGDEQAVDMGKFGESFKGQMGRKDDFGRYFDDKNAHYIGREYKNSKGEIIATEIISMGVEALYTDPAGFIEKDPEYASFVIGVLRGNL